MIVCHNVTFVLKIVLFKIGFAGHSNNKGKSQVSEKNSYRMLTF